MIEFGGVIYSLDLEAFSKAIRITNDPNETDNTDKSVKTYKDEKGKITSSEILETTLSKGLEVDTTKYELLRLLLDIVMDDVEEEKDDSLGIDRVLEKRPLSYRIAFNTLLEYNILKEE